MGRPLFSTLIEPTVRVAEPAYADDVANGGGGAVCERWSITNPFDPDDDAFFDNEHAVYEAFLTDDEVRAQSVRSALPIAQTLRGARVGVPGSSASEFLEQRRRLVDTSHFRIPFEDLLSLGQSQTEQARQTRTESDPQQYVIPAETGWTRPRRAVPNQGENGSGLRRLGHVGIRTRVLDRMLSSDASTGAPNVSLNRANETMSDIDVSDSLISAEASTQAQPSYPIRSAYPEERVRASRVQQQRFIRDAQQRLREAQLRAEDVLRSGDGTPEQQAQRVQEARRRQAETHERSRRLVEQGVHGQRHVDDMVERIREGTARTASLIRQYPDSAEARDARDALSEAHTTETLRRDDEMREEIQATQGRREQIHSRHQELRAAYSSRRIAINTNLDAMPYSDALSPSSVAASATSSSGSSRIVAPRMARSPISPPSGIVNPVPLLGFGSISAARARSRHVQHPDDDDDMPGLLDVGHSSEEEDDGLSSQTDSSSDWGTDFSGRSTPAEAARSIISPPPIVPPVGRDFAPEDEVMDWDSYYNLTRGVQRPPSPDQLNLSSEGQVEEALSMNAPESLSLYVTHRAPSDSLFTTTPIPIPTTPSSRSHARNASSGTPGAGGVLSMTPPASVTPRFLTWGARSASPPLPNAASASPTSSRRRRTSTTPAWLSHTEAWNAF